MAKANTSSLKTRREGTVLNTLANGPSTTTKPATGRLAKNAEPGAVVKEMSIPPLEFGRLSIPIHGTAPYMQARFSAKVMQAMMDKMAKGPTTKKGVARKARDFDADYHDAMHLSSEGWCGIPASAIRNACISACRIVGFKMTLAKLSVFVEADGLDKVDGTPLIKLIGTPERTQMATRNATGVADIRVRPMWREWSAVVRIKYDPSQFDESDVVNLLARAGGQVGIGEGRPDSKSSAGLGYGTFAVGEQ